MSLFDGLNHLVSQMLEKPEALVAGGEKNPTGRIFIADSRFSSELAQFCRL